MNTILVGILTVTACLLALMLEYVTRPVKREQPKLERRANGQYKRKVPVHYYGATEYIFL